MRIRGMLVPRRRARRPGTPTTPRRRFVGGESFAASSRKFVPPTGPTDGGGGGGGGSPPPTPTLVVDIGQSNRIGLCVAANVVVYPGLTTPYAAVQMFDKVAFAAADPPVMQTEGPRSMLARATISGGSYTTGMGGTELTALREMTVALPGRTFYCLKTAIDGSSMINHWNNAAYPTGGPALLSSTVSLITTWMSTWGITDPANNVLLRINQGEADTGNGYQPYYDALNSVVSTIRTGIGGTCPVMVTRTSSRNDKARDVRAAQESWVSQDSKARIVWVDDIPLRDAAHYTDDGFANVGVRESGIAVNYYNGVAAQTPQVVGVGPITTASSTQGITPVMPKHQTDDILLFVVRGIGNTNYTLSPANSFAETGSSPQHNGASGLNARLQIFWVRATSNSMSAPTLPDIGGDDEKEGFVVVIRGCTTSGSPFDATAGDTATSTTSVSCPGLTTTANNCLVLAFCGECVDSTSQQFAYGSWANGSLSPFDEHINFNTSVGAGGGIGMAAGFKATAGAVSATTATLNTTSNQARITLALKA